MLPSGNDAAHALAEYFGELLYNEAKEQEDKMKKEAADENMRLEGANKDKDGRHSGQDSI
jgi:D-alanyl-D-alanine carboxypeptidase